MTSSFSATSAFTLTHAKYLSSKVATDLRRFQRLYRGGPSDELIIKYEAELTELLKYDAVESVVYGFKRNDVWTAAVVKYVSGIGGMIAVDDDPGKIRPNLDVTGATFTSFLSLSANWFKRPESERAIITAGLPIQRSTGAEPSLEAGYWESELTYGAGGRALSRCGVRGA